MSTPFVDGCIEALTRGTLTATEVGARIRAKYAAVNTRATVFTRVRKGLFAQARQPGYDVAASKLRMRVQGTDVSPSCRQHVTAFLDARPSVQFATQRQYSQKGWECPVPDEIGALLQGVPLVPADFDALALTKDEQRLRVARQIEHLEQRRPVRLTDAQTEGVLAWMRATLVEAARAYDARALFVRRAAFNALGVALLAACGRRSIELFNGRSRFDPVISHPTLSRFSGQVKKRDKTSDDGYIIPLVGCDYATFAAAYGAFCELQRRSWARKQVSDYARLDFDAFKDKGRSMNHWLETRGPTTADAPMRFVTSKHGLRALYLALAARLYEPRHKPNMFAKIVLGHDDLKEAAAYVGNFELEGQARAPRPLFPPDDLHEAIEGEVTPTSPRSPRPSRRRGG